MTKLLKKAFERASQEFSEREQDEFARRLLKAIEADERRWDREMNDPKSSRMKKLVDQALADIREGRTQPLGPNKL
jgi:hypothetical protein